MACDPETLDEMMSDHGSSCLVRSDIVHVQDDNDETYARGASVKSQLEVA